MRFKSYKLQDLYERLSMFITSNYPDAILAEETDIRISYPHEPCRIYIETKSEEEMFLVWISRNPSQEFQKENARMHYLSTLDELNLLKSGMQTILELTISAVSVLPAKQEEMILLTDHSGNIIAQTPLSAIPAESILPYERKPIVQETFVIKGKMAYFFQR